MDIGICCPPEKAACLTDAGVNFLEVNVQSFLKPMDADDAGVAANLAAAREGILPVRAANCFLPGSLRSTGPELDLPGIVAYAKIAFRRARQAGIRHIVFGSGGSRRRDEGVDRETAAQQFTRVLEALAPLAAAESIVIVVEPLNTGECNFINSLAEGAALVNAVNAPSVRLLADIYHMLRDGEGPDEIRKYGHLLAHTHVAEKARRTAPGVEGDDLRPYLRALREVGYAGGMSLECGWEDMAAQAAGAVAALRGQMADAGFTC